MKYLYIDTSSQYLYTAIIENEKTLAEIKNNFSFELSEKALPSIVSMFEDNDIEPKEIDKIIVVNGPGSFTGIRIGITIAKVFAWSLNIPITTITALEAMAISSKTKKIHIPIIDARRNYVYAAIYDENNKEIMEPQHMSIDSLKEKIKAINNYSIISNDDLNFFDENLCEKYDPNIIEIVKCGCKNENINPHKVNPNYLKLTEAEENKLKNDN